ncbi:MAG: hypothetical protein ACR2KF_08525 [Nitrososphaeraceae archaeon]
MTKEGINDDFMQYLMNVLNEGYEQYKKDHPDFARVVEEGVPDHCESCGEWLEGFDQCSQCGRINI